MSSVNGYAISIETAAYRDLMKDKSVAVDNDTKCNITTENAQRFVLLPISFKKSWNAYKDIEHKFWTTADADLYDVSEGIKKVDDPSRDILVAVMARLSCLKFESNENDLLGSVELDIASFTCALLEIVQAPEARSFYGFESAYDCQIVELASDILQALVGAQAAGDAIEAASNTNELRENAHCWFAHVQGDTGASPAEQFLCHAALKMGRMVALSLCVAILNSHDVEALSGMETGLNLCVSTLNQSIEFASMISASTQETLPPEMVRELIDELVNSETKWLKLFLDEEVVADLRVEMIRRLETLFLIYPESDREKTLEETSLELKRVGTVVFPSILFVGADVPDKGKMENDQGSKMTDLEFNMEDSDF